MNIFFTGSVRGGRAHQKEYETIVQVLEKHGTVFSKHVSAEEVSEYGETDLTSEEILDREQQALAQSDCVVAEVTTPSLGVGYLIGRATAQEKRVIALYGGEHTLRLSAIIKGDPLVTVLCYKSEADIENLLDAEFSSTR
jgi:nucleoside 2-deoxyribosyltransferase